MFRKSNEHPSPDLIRIKQKKITKSSGGEGGGERRGRQIRRAGSGVQAKVMMDLVRARSGVTTALVSAHDGRRWIWSVNRRRDEQQDEGAL
ncbi:hypothetical protein U1Q18_020383 [Sarracenia purpurea var. burkii]